MFYLKCDLHKLRVYLIEVANLDHQGEQQVHIYNNKMHQCLQDLSNEQGHFKELTIKRHRILTKRCQRHYIFGLSEINKPLLIIAILHERMDLMQRLKHRL